MGAKTYIGTSGGPRQLGKLWIGNGGPTASPIKKMWIGTSSGPQLIFGDLISEAAFWCDAAQEIGFGNEAPFYTNLINGNQYRMQEPWKTMGGGNYSWDYGSLDDYYHCGNSNIAQARPVSYNTKYRYLDYGSPPNPNRGRPGRGGTIRLAQDTWDAAMMLVMWVDPDMPVTSGPAFFNTCFFNSMGTYEQGDDYSHYTGTGIGYMWWGGSVPGQLSIWDPIISGDNRWSTVRRLSIQTMYTRGNEMVYRLTTRTAPTHYGTLSWPGVGTIELRQPRPNAPIRDARIFDWNGGGVFAMKGELYEGLIYDRYLADDEILELEDHFMNEKYPMLG